ncbi:MAG: deoxyribonuclease IV [Actinobacteria bacterium]|nr:deoxyribonuclease IV [Actinomycetota bacterium]MCL6095540.1 deoxyribonuclease IV [Actinomycetota bacterium]
MLIGAHVGASGGLNSSLRRGAEIGAEVIQIFTQSPRTWSVVHHTQAEFEAYRHAQLDFPSVKMTFCHASYLINLCSNDSSILSSSRNVLTANLAVATQLRSSGVVLHVGSHKGRGLDSCFTQVLAEIKRSLESASIAAEEEAVPLLLENTAGAGGTIGRSLEELATILDGLDGPGQVGLRHKLGICLDTQHLWASGVSYDTPEAVERLVDRVEELIGLERLGCIHLNDSKTALGSERDRHENLGKGMIGEHSLALFLGYPKLQSVPVILEVPGGGSGPDRDQIGVARHLHELGCSMWR